MDEKEKQIIDRWYFRGKWSVIKQIRELFEGDPDEREINLGDLRTMLAMIEAGALVLEPMKEADDGDVQEDG